MDFLTQFANLPAPGAWGKNPYQQILVTADHSADDIASSRDFAAIRATASP
jgi:hypothetical protein